LADIKFRHEHYIPERTRNAFFGRLATISHVVPATKSTSMMYGIIGHSGLWSEDMIEGLEEAR
jgi:hypothetical protein